MYTECPNWKIFSSKSRMNPAVIPDFKPHTHKLHILRFCNNIVYIIMIIHMFIRKTHQSMLIPNSKD